MKIGKNTLEKSPNLITDKNIFWQFGFLKILLEWSLRDPKKLSKVPKRIRLNFYSYQIDTNVRNILSIVSVVDK